MHARHFIALAAASAAMFAASADAQVRKLTATPQAPRQAAPAGVVGFGTPSPSGLASPAPAQLTPPGAASLTPPGSPNLSSPGVAPGSPAIDAGIAQPMVGAGGGGVYIAPSVAAVGGTNVMGAAPVTRGPVSSVDIARAFMDADANRDGELSRTEAQRIGILNVPFDELDRNHDGLLSRFEYEDAFR